MCFSTIDGIEVEERRRRYPNEPRRKRLHFVKDRHSFKNSDEWTPVRPRTSERPLRQEMRDEYPPHQQYVQPMPSYGGYPPPPPPPPHFPQPMQNQGFQGQGHGGFAPHAHNGVEEFRPGHQDHLREIAPRCIEIQPRPPREPELRAHMPSNFQVNIGRSGSRSRSRRGHSHRSESRRGRSRTRSRSRDARGGYRLHSVYSDETVVDSNTGSYGVGRRHSRAPRNYGAESYDSLDGFQAPRQYARLGRRRR